MSGVKQFFIGDTHFDHKNILKYCDRPFNSVVEMNEVLVNNWNKTVGEYDIIYMLGDFALSAKERVIQFGQRLRGRKILVMGNHDTCSIQTYRDAGFWQVSKNPIVIEGCFILSHEPLFVPDDGVFVNIFAHMHNNPICKTVTSRTFCTSVERIGYTPIDFMEIKERMFTEEGNRKNIEKI